jgi:hypothetical protein
MFRALLLLRETLFADGHLSLVNAKTQDFAKAFTVCLNQLDASGREQLEPKDRAPSEGHVRFTNMILSQVQLHDSALMWQVAGRSMSASIVGNRPTEINSCACCGNVRRWLLQHVFLPKSGARFLFASDEIAVFDLPIMRHSFDFVFVDIFRQTWLL